MTQRIFDNGKQPEQVEIKNICSVCGMYECSENPVLFNFDRTEKNWFCSNCYVLILQKRMLLNLTKYTETLNKINDDNSKMILTKKQIKEIEKLKKKKVNK